MRRYYTQLRVPRTHPRLEAVLDVVIRTYGSSALADALSDLEGPPTNSLHLFFARHLLLGGSHITANFDSCIERAGKGRTEQIVHYHGSLTADPAAERLGATLRNVQRGFDGDMAARIRDSLVSPQTKAIVFCGYSGSDTFDVDPLLASLDQGRLSGKSVIWVCHDPKAGSSVDLTNTPDSRNVRRVFTLLNMAGAACTEMRGNTTEVLATLDSIWGWQTHFGDETPCRGTWVPKFQPSYEARQEASLRLNSAMGLYEEVRRLLVDAPSSAEPWLLEIVAVTLAAEGRYKDAAKVWLRVFPGDEPGDRAKREQHVASCRWREGRLTSAYMSLGRELQLAKISSVNDEIIWALAATQARVLDHMRRRPLLRLFCHQTKAGSRSSTTPGSPRRRLCETRHPSGSEPPVRVLPSGQPAGGSGCNI